MSEKPSKNGEGAEVKAEKSEGLAKKREGEQFTCPRCGRPASYIERQRKGNRVYYVAVHYKGSRKEGGKVKKDLEKCYLGPMEYVLVEKLHGLGLAGLMDRDRFKRYVREALDSAELSLKDLLELAVEVAERALELVETSDVDDSLVERAKQAYNTLIKVYGKLKERRLVERFAKA
jgi:hypothetical protein